MRKPRPNHIIGFVWPTMWPVDRTKPRDVAQAYRVRTYRKPVLSGGVSTCVHCLAPRTAVKPNESCKTSPEGKHIFATEAVTKGWSTDGQ